MSEISEQTDWNRGHDQGQGQKTLAEVSNTLADSYDKDRAHSKQVTRLALDLFDQLAGVHGLGPEERVLLRCAATFHDIDLSLSSRNHHKNSLKILLADDLLPLNWRDRLTVALIARYHRKALPSAAHEHYDSLACRRTCPRFAQRIECRNTWLPIPSKNSRRVPGEVPASAIASNLDGKVRQAVEDVLNGMLQAIKLRICLAGCATSNFC